MLSDVQGFIEDHIGEYHSSRLSGLRGIKLDDILKRKNPYLYRVKDIQLPNDLVRALLDARLSSQEEGVFGNFLERLAAFVCERAYGGRKSGAQGIDLEFDREGIRYAVAVKSGPNWGNSSQIRQMIANFQTYRRTISTSGSGIHVEFVNGCCYGQDASPVKIGGYRKLCGQDFWEFISGNADLYLQIIEPLGRTATERNIEFHKSYIDLVGLLSEKINDKYAENGLVDWEKIVRLNSASNRFR